MDRSTAWDATLRIVFGLFVVGVGNAVGGFLASTTGIFGLALYLLVAVPTFVYGVFYVVLGAGMVVEAGAESAIARADTPVVVDSDGRATRADAAGEGGGPTPDEGGEPSVGDGESLDESDESTDDES